MSLLRTLVCFCILAASVQPVMAQNAKQKQVADAELKRFEAMTKQDTAALRHMLSYDLVYVHSNGLTENKEQHLQSVGTGRIQYLSMEREESNVRLLGRTALTNGKVHVKGKVQDAAFDINLRYSATYRKKKGHWLLVNWQSTKY